MVALTLTVGDWKLWVPFVGTLFCFKIMSPSNRKKYFISFGLKNIRILFEGYKCVVLCSPDKKIHEILHYKALNYSPFRLLKENHWKL